MLATEICTWYRAASGTVSFQSRTGRRDSIVALLSGESNWGTPGITGVRVAVAVGVDVGGTEVCVTVAVDVAVAVEVGGSWVFVAVAV